MQKSIFVIALEDFLTKKFLTITFLPFFISLVLLGILFYGSFSQLFELLSSLALNPDAINDPQIAQFAQEHHWLAAIASSTIFHYIFGALFAILGTLLAVLISTAVATMVMGFFIPTIVREIHKRHYAHLELGKGLSILEYLWLLVTVFFKAIGVFILTLFVYFIPLLNAVAVNIPFYYFFHSLYVLDVGGEIYSKNELMQVLKKHRPKIMGTTLILYLITLIPFAGMLLQVYFVSVLAHLFFRLKSS
ncbi:EI24 domain-containing protein [Nitratiruptor sp. YY09-18]|uniref:EI24 domain-containing protein n=1 Tax=Nitratiruptor sp. YY09-18 TaxID=2724901 RepID=UPI0019159BDF|nr:EI24 domain-containing protein [Nitratiruptor sp. YY09-18]BCD67757.1 hypothetical protein NitYY0918_C0664 [Nitratiruptor sp. YY09-18]